MKKRTLLLVLCLLVFVTSLLMTAVAFASTATVTTTDAYYKGEYGELFADQGEKKAQLQEIYGKEAIILFGEVTNLPDGAEFGIVRYPKGDTHTSANAVYMPGKAKDSNGKFGVAVSLRGAFLNSGEWSARAYIYEGEAKAEDEAFTSQDLQYMTFGGEYDFSTNDTVVITTAEQFMNIGTYKPGTHFELGKDIDLTQEEWTQSATYGYKYLGNNNQINITNLTYLIDTIPQNITIDGRGHKITASYDESEYESGPVAIIARAPAISGAKSTIKNLIVDFTVNGDSVSGEPFGGLFFHADAVNFENCYFKLGATFNSGDPKRMSVAGRVSNATSFTNCIAEMEAKINGNSTAINGFFWTNYGNSATKTDCTLIGKGKDYEAIDAFIAAWEKGTVTNQSTYTAWSVENGKVLLNGRKVA